jgi:recombination protein RecA
VEKTGTWYSFGDQRIGQGRENAKVFLKENPDIMKAMEEAVLQRFGGNREGKKEES